VSSRSQFTRLCIAGLDAETAKIDICGKEVRQQDIGCKERKLVVVDEGPDRELGTLEQCACSEDGEDEKGGVEC
jgi:hypothetical protein